MGLAKDQAGLVCNGGQVVTQRHWLIANPGGWELVDLSSWEIAAVELKNSEPQEWHRSSFGFLQSKP